MSCALEINSSDGFRLACKMLLFSHEEHISTTNILMVSKLGSLASYREGDPPIKSHNSLVLWSCKIIWRTKNIFTTRVSMAIKRGRMVTYCDGLPLLKSYNPSISQKRFGYKLKHISTYTVAMATKMTGWWLSLRRSTWSCKIVLQTEAIISPLPQCLWPPNMAGYFLTLTGSLQESHMALKFCGHVRSHDKLKTSPWSLSMANILGKGVRHNELPPIKSLSVNRIFLWGHVTLNMLYLLLH